MRATLTALLASLLLGAPPAAQAQFTYTTNAGVIILAGYSGSGGAVIISNFVTSIGYQAFEGCIGLASVTIPNSVVNIGVSAFLDCTGLTNVTMAGSVAGISQNAFGGCANLTALYFMGNAPSFGDSFEQVPATVYYLPGTTGWTLFSVLTGLPAVLWSTPPAIAFTSPTSGSNYSTISNTISLGGTASDIMGVTNVTWTNSRTGGAGTASGTNSWSASNISLDPGDNPIAVTAYDSAGDARAATLTVTLITGSLQLTILPPAAAHAGAQWQLDGGPTLLNSGATMSNLLVGSHTVSFIPVSGWTTPADQIVSVSNYSTASVTGSYLSLHVYPAAASAVPTNGFVVAVNVTDGGYGYTNTPNVRIIGGGGSGAQAEAAVSNGMVIAVQVLDAGHGYTNAPMVIIDPPFANPILGIAPASALVFSNLTVGGVYQLQQSVAWYWSNQPVHFTATNSVFTDIVPGVINSGAYRLALEPVPAQAFAAPEVVNGFVVGATVTDGGSGYFTNPTVSIVGGGGDNAGGVSQISGGVVTAITITNAGIGYTGAPMVEIGQPPAAAMSPAVQLVMRVDFANLNPYENYQIQFTPDLGATWGNWNGGLFTPTDVTNSQYLVVTNAAGFFRLQYAP